MTMATINRAANDPQLQARVMAAAQKEIVFNEDLASTDFGRQLAAGVVNVMPLMWRVAIDTEAAYEAALLADRAAPGHDKDVITDGQITAAVAAGWPQDQPGPPA